MRSRRFLWGIPRWLLVKYFSNKKTASGESPGHARSTHAASSRQATRGRHKAVRQAGVDDNRDIGEMPGERRQVDEVFMPLIGHTRRHGFMKCDYAEAMAI